MSSGKKKTGLYAQVSHVCRSSRLHTEMYQSEPSMLRNADTYCYTVYDNISLNSVPSYRMLPPQERVISFITGRACPYIEV